MIELQHLHHFENKKSAQVWLIRVIKTNVSRVIP